MKKISFLLMILLTATLFGQPVKTINNEKTHESYEVLLYDTTIRNGRYLKFGCNPDDTLITGFYKYGLKDSLWNENMSKGFYDHGNKVGIWEFYNFKGKVYCRYDYSEQRLKTYTFYISLKPTRYHIVVEGDTLYKKLKRRPVAIGYMTSWLNYADSYPIHYSHEAIQNNVTGKVVVSFMIHEDGNTSDFKVESALEFGCDELSLEIARNIVKWTPGIYKGNPVKVKNIITVNFQLLNEENQGRSGRFARIEVKFNEHESAFTTYKLPASDSKNVKL